MPDPRFSPQDIKEHSSWLYGVALSDDEATDLHSLLVKLSKVHGWSTKEICGTSCGLAIWLKSRLAEMGCFNVKHEPPQDIRSETTLHCFFIHITETPQQVSRLQYDQSEPSALQKEVRSRLRKYMETKQVQPIDRTALRVAPPPTDGN